DLGCPVLPVPLDTDLAEPPMTEVAELHFAPVGSSGLASRMALIADWIARARPDLMVIDVSVEVALLARLCGVPFVYARQTGIRNDPPHLTAYRWATALWAPFDESREEESTPEWVKGKTFYSGAVTRFDGLPRPPRPDGGSERRALISTAADEEGERLRAHFRHVPGWQVRPLPATAGLDDFAGAAVVIGPGGNNLVSETAFARRGLICVPQPRPFGEQEARARLLRSSGMACVFPPGEWTDPGVALETAVSMAPRLESWCDGHGADRAASFLDETVTSMRSLSGSHSINPAALSSSSHP
ncbi:MAG: hypothetical protein M3Y45_02355, partial [Actinomycetota bacterium]|nr:hypothetical protein [Actinomycetota bacterium]